nr:MAG TPA: hypothetical protein [Caudoviricetes sp.]
MGSSMVRVRVIGTMTLLMRTGIFPLPLFYPYWNIDIKLGILPTPLTIETSLYPQLFVLVSEN